MEIQQAAERARVRALQLSLWDEDFSLDDERREFVHGVLEGLTARDAAKRVRPTLSDRQADNWAHRLLGERRADGTRGDPEVHRYLAWRRSEVAARQQITEDELAAKWRRVYEHGVGDLPLLRTVDVRGGEGQAATQVEQLRFEPSLPAANAALDGLRRLAGLGKDLEPTRVSAVSTANAAIDAGLDALAKLPPETREKLERLLEELRADIERADTDAAAGDDDGR